MPDQSRMNGREPDSMKSTLQEILISAPNSSVAIRELYQFLKKQNPRFSLAQICRKSGIPSTGYLSDVMSGKRVLSRKYGPAVAKSLNLGGAPEEYLVLLVEIDHADDGTKLSVLKDQLESLRRVMDVHVEAVPRPFQDDMLFYLIVFSSFALFGHEPSTEDLVNYFGVERDRKVREALTHLEKQGLVERQGDRFVQRRERVLFQDSEDGFSHIRFLRQSLEDAKTKLNFWYDRPAEAHIASSIITINARHYKELLPRIRTQLLQMQTALDHKEADALLRFNISIYPEKPL